MLLVKKIYVSICNAYNLDLFLRFSTLRFYFLIQFLLFIK